MAATGMHEVAPAFGDEAMGRFGTLMARFGDLHVDPPLLPGDDEDAQPALLPQSRLQAVVEEDLPGGGLHFWTIRRDPRS